METPDREAKKLLLGEVYPKGTLCPKCFHQLAKHHIGRTTYDGPDSKVIHLCSFCGEVYHER